RGHAVPGALGTVRHLAVPARRLVPREHLELPGVVREVDETVGAVAGPAREAGTRGAEPQLPGRLAQRNAPATSSSAAASAASADPFATVASFGRSVKCALNDPTIFGPRTSGTERDQRMPSHLAASPITSGCTE